MSELEAIIWCPDCEIDLFEVHRMATRREGVYQNRLDPLPDGRMQEDHKNCNRCGGLLERK